MNWIRNPKVEGSNPSRPIPVGATTRKLAWLRESSVPGVRPVTPRAYPGDTRRFRDGAGTAHARQTCLRRLKGRAPSSCAPCSGGSSSSSSPRSPARGSGRRGQRRSVPASRSSSRSSSCRVAANRPRPPVVHRGRYALRDSAPVGQLRAHRPLLQAQRAPLRWRFCARCSLSAAERSVMSRPGHHRHRIASAWPDLQPTAKRRQGPSRFGTRFRSDVHLGVRLLDVPEETDCVTRADQAGIHLAMEERCAMERLRDIERCPPHGTTRFIAV